MVFTELTIKVDSAWEGILTANLDFAVPPPTSAMAAGAVEPTGACSGIC